MGLIADGLKRFDKQSAIYIRPMYWAEGGDKFAGVAADPDATRWGLCLYETSPLQARARAPRRGHPRPPPPPPEAKPLAGPPKGGMLDPKQGPPPPGGGLAWFRQ